MSNRPPPRLPTGRVREPRGCGWWVEGGREPPWRRWSRPERGWPLQEASGGQRGTGAGGQLPQGVGTDGQTLQPLEASVKG